MRLNLVNRSTEFHQTWCRGRPQHKRECTGSSTKHFLNNNDKLRDGAATEYRPGNVSIIMWQLLNHFETRWIGRYETKGKSAGSLTTADELRDDTDTEYRPSIVNNVTRKRLGLKPKLMGDWVTSQGRPSEVLPIVLPVTPFYPGFTQLPSVKLCKTVRRFYPPTLMISNYVCAC